MSDIISLALEYILMTGNASPPPSRWSPSAHPLRSRRIRGSRRSRRSRGMKKPLDTAINGR
ncbi:MAG: hypothetical protein A2Z99_21350 [Treponema sp. GWB1_62_6]|nr:MAG: hypothetical protein A2Y36_04410 [Treponema sp. GWA1_62_8]OHE63539.1 MAG: hypothetical protein A2Z99_21350 [Treponema sp. GWB1_62_6]OHE63709.1 MAG: hypothetical protein A2001_00605 [Treponema sp. GWC1_61_84]OHE72739.1 MAG: hypothetical protein A2413_20035 [Treponema sp. RIFOXYC1_FULL_61_9]HCM26825.1 hypothetical protein [Treponema sp.]